MDIGTDDGGFIPMSWSWNSTSTSKIHYNLPLSMTLYESIRLPTSFGPTLLMPSTLISLGISACPEFTESTVHSLPPVDPMPSMKRLVVEVRLNKRDWTGLLRTAKYTTHDQPITSAWKVRLSISWIQHAWQQDKIKDKISGCPHRTNGWIATIDYRIKGGILITDW